jgi:hypothetical protein
LGAGGRSANIRGKRPRRPGSRSAKRGGFSLIFKDRYLLLIAVGTVLLNIINTSGEFLLGKFVVAEAGKSFPGGVEMLAERASQQP